MCPRNGYTALTVPASRFRDSSALRCPTFAQPRRTSNFEDLPSHPRCAISGQPQTSTFEHYGRRHPVHFPARDHLARRVLVARQPQRLSLRPQLGVRLSVASTPRDGALPPLRLKVQASDGALTPALESALRRHRDELHEFVFSLEEHAAVLEFCCGHSRENAEEGARSCVPGGSASRDGRLWLRDLAEHHPVVRYVLDLFGAEIVEVTRSEAA
jgi:hypothetical protein